MTRLKLLGIIATIAGVGVNLLSDWVGDKQLDEKIEEKVSEALAEKTEDTES